MISFGTDIQKHTHTQKVFISHPISVSAKLEPDFAESFKNLISNPCPVQLYISHRHRHRAPCSVVAPMRQKWLHANRQPLSSTSGRSCTLPSSFCCLRESTPSMLISLCDGVDECVSLLERKLAQQSLSPQVTTVFVLRTWTDHRSRARAFKATIALSNHALPNR